ncbi:MAG: hypothetical protein AAF560_04830, partial [Acidobacteriota bacterium]
AEAFMALDADLLLFRPLDDLFLALDEHQFVACDYQWRSGFRYVFEPKAAERAGFSPDDTFNGGFWGSRGDALSPSELERWFSRLGEARRLFDFSSGTNNQPLLNHLVASTGLKYVNLTRQRLAEGSREPGSWAGSPNFERRGDVLFDRDLPLRYLHWAGYRLDSAAPYGELWAEARAAALTPSLLAPSSLAPSPDSR